MTDTSTADEVAVEEAEVEPATIHGCIAEVVRGVTVVHADTSGYEALIGALLNDGYTFCADLCAVDQLVNTARCLPAGMVPERFEIVVNLRNMEAHEVIRVRCQVAGGAPTVPSLFGLYPGTEAMEREAYDLFGVCFTGHPDLTRILLPEGWEGHPLRKDHAQGKVPVQFKAPQTARHATGDTDG